MTGTSAKPRCRRDWVQSEMDLIEVGKAEATPSAEPLSCAMDSSWTRRVSISEGRPRKSDHEIGTQIGDAHLAGNRVEVTAAG